MSGKETAPLPLTGPHLQVLCDWAAGCEIEGIPGDVVRHAAVVLADDLAAIISARNDPVLIKITKQYLQSSGKQVSTVFNGACDRADRYSAAAINGAAAPWNELDEGSRRVPCHGGIYVLPALLAEAEAEQLSLRETLRCLVVAYEVITRIGLAFQQPSLQLHPHASLCAIGAAAAIAAARRYDADNFLNTLTVASTLVSPGPFDHAVRGSFARNMWVSAGAWSGMRAADWTLCGVTGLAESPREVFCEVFKTLCCPEYLSEGLGADWQISHNFQKIYPCCQYSHSMIEAIAELAETVPDDTRLQDCENAIIEIHEKGMLLNERNPGTILAARFSVPHIAAVAAIYGKVDIETLSPESLASPDIAALRQRIEIRLFEPRPEPPNDRPARVRFRFQDGREYTSECLNARGSPGAPLAPDAIWGKIEAICRKVYPNLPVVMNAVAELDARLLDKPWAEVVSQITGDRE